MSRVFIIAEVGVNHNGSLQMAHDLIDLAANAGADAVKFQTFVAEEVISRFAPKAPYQRRLTPEKETQLDMVRRLQLDERQHYELIRHCRSRGIEFLATPFDHPSVDLLERSGVSRLKIGSGDITNAPLLMRCAQTGKPIILSTGMSKLGEIEEALGVLAFGYCHPGRKPSPDGFRESFSSSQGQAVLRKKVSLLHCTSEYPAPLAEVNLLAMRTLRQAFTLPVGYSDHTPGITVPIAAAALGAVIIEKHFTLDRRLPGPDHKASLEPAAFEEMVNSIRQVELALGSPVKSPTFSEQKNLPLVRRSLVAKRDIRQGEVFTEENLGVKRPGTGVSPLHYWDYLGRNACRDYQADEEIM